MVATVTTTTRLSKTSQGQILFAWKLQLLTQYEAIERFLVENIVCCFVSEFYVDRWYGKLEAGHNMAF